MHFLGLLKRLLKVGLPKTITEPKTTTMYPHAYMWKPQMYNHHGFGYNHHHYVSHAYICGFHMYANGT